jgi:hypothetical protein
MRFCYAEPPYSGKAGCYPEAEEVDHRALVQRLAIEGPDGWALSTSATALAQVLALCPLGVRVCSWHRAVRPTRSERPISAWEPLIVCGGRELRSDRPAPMCAASIGRSASSCPGWAQHEAPVHCFADPDAHAHGDRDPSCSVNIETGAWHCWGCGAKGGAYDAALARGLGSRRAFELKLAYGLAERDSKRPRPSRSVPVTRGAGRGLASQLAPTARPSLAMDERQLGEASARLARLLWPPRAAPGSTSFPTLRPSRRSGSCSSRGRLT